MPLSEAPQKKGWWATGDKGTIQIVLFLTTLGASALNTTNTAAFFIDAAKSTISLMGIGILISYARFTAHLSKKEIAGPLILGAVFGFSSSIVPHVLGSLAKSIL